MAQKPRSKALSCAAKSYSLLEKRLPKGDLGVKVPRLPGGGLYRPLTSGMLHIGPSCIHPSRKESWKTNTGHVPLAYAAALYMYPVRGRMHVPRFKATVHPRRRQYPILHHAPLCLCHKTPLLVVSSALQVNREKLTA